MAVQSITHCAAIFYYAYIADFILLTEPRL